jgi:hypothetical protein
MLRLKPFRKFRISNRLAVLGAFLLLAATVAGSSNSLPGQAGSVSGMTASTQTTPTAEGSGQETMRSASQRKSKGFKVSLFLFRRN